MQTEHLRKASGKLEVMKLPTTGIFSSLPDKDQPSPWRDIRWSVRLQATENRCVLITGMFFPSANLRY